jgi:hypothetical protein
MSQKPSKQVVFEYLQTERFGATPKLIAARTDMTLHAVEIVLARLESLGVAKPSSAAKKFRAVWILTGDSLPATPRAKVARVPGHRVSFGGAENLALMSAAFHSHRATGVPTDHAFEPAEAL